MKNITSYKLSLIPTFFFNRNEAGNKLARLLERYVNEKCIVYAIPRGGVIIGKEVAERLNCFLDIVSIKKIGHPENPEYAIGAVSDTGHAIYNRNELEFLDKNWLEEESIRKQEEAIKTKNAYTRDIYFDIKNKTAVIVDDGIATGLDMLLAIKEIKNKNPKKIVVAVPVASCGISKIIQNEVDEFVSLISPVILGSVGAYYDNFDSISDKEAIEIMESNTGNLYQKSRLY